jgi:hypothetical protein
MFKRNAVPASILALATLCLLSAVINAQKGPEVVAGAPLKGVDVKLGKNPGGSPAARATTDSEGKFNLGVVPAGSYILTLDFPDESKLNQGSGTISTKEKGPSAVNVKLALITIDGAVGGRMVRGWDPKNKKSVDLATKSTAKAAAPEKIILESDGHNPLIGICETAIVKSKSNITNN